MAPASSAALPSTALVDAGHDVVVVSRSRRAPTWSSGLGARSVRGDVLDLDSLVRAYEGADAVVNLATEMPVGHSALLPVCLAAPRPAAHGRGRQRGRGGPPGRRTTGGAGERQLRLRRPGRRLGHRAEPDRHHPDDRAGRGGGVARPGLRLRLPGRGGAALRHHRRRRPADPLLAAGRRGRPADRPRPPGRLGAPDPHRRPRSAPCSPPCTRRAGSTTSAPSRCSATSSCRATPTRRGSRPAPSVGPLGRWLTGPGSSRWRARCGSARTTSPPRPAGAPTGPKFDACWLDARGAPMAPPVHDRAEGALTPRSARPAAGAGRGLRGRAARPDPRRHGRVRDSARTGARTG